MMVASDDYVYWEDATRTAIRVDYSQQAGRIVSAEERVYLIYRAYELAATVPQDVTLVVDLRTSVTIRAANWLTLMRQLLDARPANVPRLIVVGTRRAALYQNVIDILRRLRTDLAETTFVNTLEEAHALLDSGRQVGSARGSR